MNKAIKKFNEEWKKKEVELRRLGIPETLLNRARRFGEEYILGVASRFFSELPPSKREEIEQYLVNDAIMMAERWVKGIMKLTEVI